MISYTRRQGQSGQIALIVLLLMAVMLTVGISIASRSIMDIALSRQEEESSRTFQAAESGIEEALSQDLAVFLNNATERAESIEIDGMNVLYTVKAQTQLQTSVEQGGATQVNVAGAQNGNQLEIQWSRKICNPASPPASLLIRVYNNANGTATARNHGIGPCGMIDHFPDTGVSPGADPYKFKYTLDLQTGDTVVSIHPVEADTDLLVKNAGGWPLPVQQYAIRSQATNPGGDESRAVQVTRTQSAVAHPSVLDFALYSGSTLSVQ